MSKRPVRLTKAERKARDPQPQETLAGTWDVPWSEEWLAVGRQQRRTVTRLLSNDINDQSCDASVANTAAFAQRVAKKSLPLVSSTGAPVACKAGCHWCCHFRVATSVPEVVWLANYLRKSWAGEELAALRERLEQLAADPRVMSKDFKPESRIACALLKDGRCSAYSHRPLACRKAHAFDAATCERALDAKGISSERNDDFVIAFEASVLGMEAGFCERGAPASSVELTRALDIALREDKALERWLAGEALFAEAQLEQSELEKRIGEAIAAE